MNFDLSEEHRMLQETVRAFVAKEVAPRAATSMKPASFRGRRCGRWAGSVFWA